MLLPTSIKNILNPSIVESSRIEFKQSWNPESVMHTICAFANDIDNFSGGYIIIGIEEENGLPKYPLKGLLINEIDKIQKEVIEYCHKSIEPKYIPLISVEDIDDVSLIVLWVPGGAERPYKCKVNVYGKNDSLKAYYIRKGSTTIKATLSDEKELFQLSGLLPFDDRVNYKASLKNLSINLIENYLGEIGSKLYDNIPHMSIDEIASNMKICDGPIENIKPKNVGLLFFNYSPENFFPYAYIDLVNIPDPTGEGMIEKKFTGPLHIQYRDVMLYLKNNIIEEKVFKIPGEIEAMRVFNYPYEVLEEIISNAILHKSYQIPEPISIRINKESIEITSLPGIDSSIKTEDIKNLKLNSKKYRNRRISEFLKELKIVEAKNTGFPTILKYIKLNKSPLPVIEVDDERTYITVILYINERFKNKSSRNPKKENLQDRTIKALQQKSMNLTDLSMSLGYKNIPGSLKKCLGKLMNNDIIVLHGKEYKINET